MAETVTFGRRGVARTAPQWHAPVPSPVARGVMTTPRVATAPVADSGERTILGYFGWLLFSFNGRLDRSTYRYCRIVANAGYLLLIYGLRAQLPTLMAGSATAGLLVLLALIPLSGLMIWTTLAMQVKRRHDRDKGWPWLFVGFIPIAGPIWVLIETCWLDGTPGFNRYDESSTTAEAFA